MSEMKMKGYWDLWETPKPETWVAPLLLMVQILP